MNRKSILVSLVAAAFLLCAIRFASAQPKGETVTLKGEVIDLWCYLEGGDKEVPRPTTWIHYGHHCHSFRPTWKDTSSRRTIIFKAEVRELLQ